LPHALPDGKTILFTPLGANSSGLKMEGFSTHAVSLDSGERKRILDNSADARYVESGHLVFAREGVIMAAPFDPQRLEVTGPEVRAIEGVMQSIYCGNPNSSTAAAQFAVSETGLLAYVAGQICPDTPRPLVWVDRDGEEQTVGAPDDGYLSMRVSPDGRMLLLTVPYPPHPAVWTYDLERKTLRKQTFDQAVTFAVWGPGPDRITYDALDDAERRLFTRPLDAGPGAEEPFGDLVGLEPGSWDLAGERFVGLIRLEDGRARIHASSAARGTGSFAKSWRARSVSVFRSSRPTGECWPTCRRSRAGRRSTCGRTTPRDARCRSRRTPVSAPCGLRMAGSCSSGAGGITAFMRQV
jgi:hypothetical protein